MRVLPKAFISLLFCLAGCSPPDQGEIDRRALIGRHCPVHDSMDFTAPFSVGNGEFAFTVDVTGLQTFAREHEDFFPLGTKANFAWHSMPNPGGYSMDAYPMTEFPTHGRMAPYYYAERRNYSPEAKWLEANPHSLHLGFVQLYLKKSDGNYAKPGDLEEIHQNLDLWTGTIESRFTLEGSPVRVHTACHPDQDQIAIRIESPLIQQGRIGIRFFFPYASGTNGPGMVELNRPGKHYTAVLDSSEQHVHLRRTLDQTVYHVRAVWEQPSEMAFTQEHIYEIIPGGGHSSFDAVVRFEEEAFGNSLAGAEETMEASAAYWEKFWTEGAVVDLSGSLDERWFELERRIVLSKYLMAVNCSGSLPPQETGLTHNSWFGSYHLEMHWVHAAHFPLWNHPEMLTRCFPFLTSVVFERGLETARLQGYEGVRWGKGMRGWAADPRPNYIEPFLVWQQPHFLYFLELLYRRDQDTARFGEYREVWEATADFMASYALWNPVRECYELGPPIGTAQERSPHESTVNPTFELAYWVYGLELAQAFNERLGFPRNKKWDHVIENLPGLPVLDGTYLIAENEVATWTDPGKWTSHPSMLFAYGMLPETRLVDKDIMNATLDTVMAKWRWDMAWGWDFPFTAMTAARLNRPDLAIELLMMDNPKNRFLKNGHSHQNSRLLAYLPSNGSLLTAIALMAAGWDDAPGYRAPGFPRDGSWNVKFEGLHRLP